jgi:probable HAF family extracellular repeat protein
MGSGFRALVAALAASASLAAQAIGGSWTSVDLTPEGPGMANAVSQNGIVVGCRLAGAETRAFVYMNGQRSDLAAPAGAQSCAVAVNNNGLVAGRINGEITIWQNGTPRGLGVQGNVTGLTDGGIVVGSMNDGSGAASRAFMWSNGIFTDLGPGSAIGINGSGQVAVISTGGALYVYENGTWRNLNANVINAYGFNDRGEIVGMGSFGHGPEAVIYDGTVHGIPGASGEGGAVAINNVGQVLTSYEGSYGHLLEAGQEVSLAALPGVDAKWGHSEGRALNDRSWIVGQGGSASDSHAFLIMPKSAPAPASSGNPLERPASRTRALIRFARSPQT